MGACRKMVFVLGGGRGGGAEAVPATVLGQLLAMSGQRDLANDPGPFAHQILSPSGERKEARRAGRRGDRRRETGRPPSPSPTLSPQGERASLRQFAQRAHACRQDLARGGHLLLEIRLPADKLDPARLEHQRQLVPHLPVEMRQHLLGQDDPGGSRRREAPETFKRSANNCRFW